MIVWGHAPSDPNDTSGFPKCSIGATNVACPPSSASYPYACAIYPGDPVVADATGICIERSACVGLSSELPGGIDCYDAGGIKLNP